MRIAWWDQVDDQKTYKKLEENLILENFKGIVNSVAGKNCDNSKNY